MIRMRDESKSALSIHIVDDSLRVCFRFPCDDRFLNAEGEIVIVAGRNLLADDEKQGLGVTLAFSVPFKAIRPRVHPEMISDNREIEASLRRFL